MLQYKFTHCGAAGQEPIMWCCSEGHTMWCRCTNIYFTHFTINTVPHFCPSLVLIDDILITVFAIQLGSHRHNARYTCPIHLSKWHYVEEHNNPVTTRWWRSPSDTIDRMLLTMSEQTLSLQSVICHRNTSQRNNGFSPKSISVPNAQTWRLLICRVICRALKYFANFTHKKINSSTGFVWVYQSTNHLQRAF
jgi:hypothetical protein